jgi:hypothetical protein
VYVALALAHDAAGQCEREAPPSPLLAAVVNNQRLAIRELGGALDRVLPDVAGAPPPQGARRMLTKVNVTDRFTPSTPPPPDAED